MLPTNRTKYCPWARRSICTEVVRFPGWKQLNPGTLVKFVSLAPVVLTTAVALIPPPLQDFWKPPAGVPLSLSAFATLRPRACLLISWSAIDRTLFLSLPFSAA